MRSFLKKIFRLRRRGLRKTGYYWVKFSYAGERQWRIGWYDEKWSRWDIDGDDRDYYDNDFVTINERPIPRIWLPGTEFTYWVISVTFTLLACILSIYSLITIITQ